MAAVRGAMEWITAVAAMTPAERIEMMWQLTRDAWTLMGAGLSRFAVLLLPFAGGAILSASYLQALCPEPDERPERVVHGIFVDPGFQPVREAGSVPTFQPRDIRPLTTPEDAQTCARLADFVRASHGPQEGPAHANFYAANDMYIVVRWMPEDEEEQPGRGPRRVRLNRDTVVYLLDSAFEEILGLTI